VIAAFFVALKLLLKYIWKKEKPKDGKHDKKLDQDNAPELFTPGHGLKTIAIKPENPF
jgi:hypothetical protein